jgi:tetratricopeptide (TPR) repeat protein
LIAYLGEYEMSRGNFIEALNHLENANVLDPNLGLAYLLRGKLYMVFGMAEAAEAVLEDSMGVDLPTAQDYVDRGQLYENFESTRTRPRITTPEPKSSRTMANSVWLLMVSIQRFYEIPRFPNIS